METVEMKVKLCIVSYKIFFSAKLRIQCSTYIFYFSPDSACLDRLYSTRRVTRNSACAREIFQGIGIVGGTIDRLYNFCD